MVDIKETSAPIQRANLEGAGINWEKLQSSVEELLPLFRYSKANYDIEEDPPVILKDGFIPHSWVGSYPKANLQIVPAKITDLEYKTMKKDIKRIGKRLEGSFKKLEEFDKTGKLE